MEDLYQTELALRKVFFLPRILGAFPFNKNYQITKTSVFWSLTVLFTAVCLSSTTHFYYSFLKVNIRRTLKIVAANITNFLSFLVLLKNKDMVLILKQGLETVEQELANEGVRWKWDRKLMLAYRTHVVFVFLLAVTIGLRLHEDENTFLSNLSCFLSYIGTLPILLTIIGQFISIQDIICSLFDSILQLKKNRSIVVSISALHTATESSQKIYGLQLLLYIVCTSSFVICNTFLEISTREPLYSSFIHVLWLVAYIAAILDVVMACNRTVAKVIIFVLFSAYFVL